MLGRKTGACKEILFSPHRSYVFFNLLRYFGRQWSRKHLIFLLFFPHPSVLKAAWEEQGHSPAPWHCAHCTHTLFTPKMFYFPAPLSKAAFHCCACSVHPAQELQPAGSCAAPELELHQGLGSRAVCVKGFVSLRDELSKLHRCSGFPFHSGYLCRVNLRTTPATTQFLELGIEAQQCQEMQSPVPFSIHCC